MRDADRPGYAWMLVRNEPFRVFFPLAAILGAVGVSHWILFSTGAIHRYMNVFHAVTQTEAFLPAFAAGFLMTAIPKRTKSAPASRSEVLLEALCLVLVPCAAALDLVWLAQLAYAAALLLLARFALRRLGSRGAGRRPPASFAMVPIALLSGTCGAALFAYGTRTGAPVWALSMGRGLVFDGVFTCLVIGVGGLFLPLALHGEGPPDVPSSDWPRFLPWTCAGVAVVASIGLQVAGHDRLGPLVRALVVAIALVRSRGLSAPSRPGWNRRLVLAAAWAVPTGLALAAAFPAHRIAVLHVTYVGGFGLLAFAVAAHVTLGHAGFPALQSGRPWPVAVFAALFALAAGLRAIATALPDDYVTWLGWAATAWLVAAVVWSLFLFPKMWSAPRAAAEGSG